MTHAPEPWSQGRTLRTQQTRRWTDEQRATNDEVESKLLFANFRSSDEGRARTLIAQFERAEDCAHAAHAVNNHDALLAALEAHVKHIAVHDRACCHELEAVGRDAIAQAAKAEEEQAE